MHCSLQPPQQIWYVCSWDREIDSTLNFWGSPVLLFVAEQQLCLHFQYYVDWTSLVHNEEDKTILCGYHPSGVAITWYCSAPAASTGKTAPHYFPFVVQLSLCLLFIITAAKGSRNVKAALHLDSIRRAIPSSCS